MARTARFVVGPDEPYGDKTYEDMAHDHWTMLSAVAMRDGIDISAADLSALPHDVEFSDDLLGYISGEAHRQRS